MTPKPAPPPADDDWKDTFRTVIFAIFIALGVRSFLYEPFNIPSGSMIPTLLVGDFLFVSKYSYGYSTLSSFWGVPLFDGRLGGDKPKRGDVVVFKLPRDDSTDYIKRLIGLPGDRVQMKQGVLWINGEAVKRETVGDYSFTLRPGDNERPGGTRMAMEYRETLPNGRQHPILEEGDDYPLDNTQEFVVPPRHYFMMGDNRDNSQDSRVSTAVGFVPEENLVGRAEVIFFSLADGAHFWEFWKWPFHLRLERMFTKIR